jgi:hypothetical protein
MGRKDQLICWFCPSSAILAFGKQIFFPRGQKEEISLRLMADQGASGSVTRRGVSYRKKGQPAPTPQLSCQLCRERKVKCDKGNPCLSCVSSSATCIPTHRARLPRGRHVKRDAQVTVSTNPKLDSSRQAGLATRRGKLQPVSDGQINTASSAISRSGREASVRRRPITREENAWEPLANKVRHLDICIWLDTWWIDFSLQPY